MKAHNEQPHKSGSLLAAGFTLGKLHDWWKHNHPINKTFGGGAINNSVKTGLWKTYSAKNPGKKK
jgi:hypothetical protein